MELWIRSQDKQSLMICKRITIIDNIDACVINADNGTWDYDIGIYKTTERALEVLDEIQKRLKSNVSYKKNSLYLSNGYNYFEIPYEESSQVYEMPQD